MRVGWLQKKDPFSKTLMITSASSVRHAIHISSRSLENIVIRFGIVHFFFSGMKNLLTWENKNVQAWFRYRCRHPRKNMTFCLACRC